MAGDGGDEGPSAGGRCSGMAGARRGTVARGTAARRRRDAGAVEAAGVRKKWQRASGYC
jgi:hypothetical protein